VSELPLPPGPQQPPPADQVPTLPPAAPRVTPGLRSWAELRPALQFWLLLLASSLGAMIYVQASGDTSPRTDLAITVFDLVVIACFALPQRRDLAPLLDPRRCSTRALALAALTAVVAGLVLTAWFWLAQHVFRVEPILDDFRKHDWPLWSAFVLTVVVPPVGEEIAFRGILFDRLQRVMTPKEAWLVQGILFGFLHLSPSVFPSHIFLGLVLGWLRMRTGSLLPSMLVHALWNGWVLVGELAGIG
jgi:membrane protease YdiL (CAAX protease family)